MCDSQTEIMSILRKLFGPSREEVWRELSAHIDAKVVAGGFWKGDRVEARVGEWTVTLDTYTVSTGKTHVVYTRMRAPYVNADGFRFTVYRRGLFSDLVKWLGAQDIEIGDPAFDRDFMLKSNDRLKLQYLLGNRRVRDLIALQPDIRFEVRDDEGWFGARFPEGVDELCFHVVGVIKDVERLARLFELFAETLHQLCHIGSAYEKDPGLTLS